MESSETTEVRFTNGTAGASSHNHDGVRTENGFVIKDRNKLWASGPQERLPVFIWYDFKNRQIIPTRISFHPRRDTTVSQTWNSMDFAKRLTPTKFQFVGSNDAVCNRNSTWTILCKDLSGNQIASQNETRQCRVEKWAPPMPACGTLVASQAPICGASMAPLPSCQKYRCLGLKRMR